MRPSIAVCLLTGLSMVAYGLLNPALTTLLVDRGTSASGIGLAIASWAIPISLLFHSYRYILRQRSEGRVAAASLVLSAFPVPFLPMSESLLGVCLLQAAHGATFGIFWVAGSSIIMRRAPTAWRGRLLALYGVVPSAGAFLGSLLARIIPQDASFLGVAAILLAAGVLAAASLFHENENRNVSASSKTSPASTLGVIGIYLQAFISGIFESAPWGLMIVFGLASGLSNSGALTLLSAYFIGQMLFALPIGLATDRFGTARLLTTLSVASIAVTFVVAFAPAPSWLLIVGIVLWGGLLNGYRSVAHTALTERVSNAQIVSASAGFVFFANAGEIAGPILGGGMMDAMGQIALPLLVLVAVLLSAVIAAGGVILGNLNTSRKAL